MFKCHDSIYTKIHEYQVFVVSAWHDARIPVNLASAQEALTAKDNFCGQSNMSKESLSSCST